MKTDDVKPAMLAANITLGRKPHMLLSTNVLIKHHNPELKQNLETKSKEQSLPYVITNRIATLFHVKPESIGSSV